MRLKKITLVMLGLEILLFSCSVGKNGLKKINTVPNAQLPATAKVDTTKKGVRSYKDIITDKAVTKNGLIKVHKSSDRYYFELSDILLGKDMLIVNRVSKAAAGFRTEFGGYGGDQIGENVIQFVKGPKDKLFIERKSYLDISHDSSQNGMYRSLMNSSLPAIVASFDIKAFSPDSTGSIIDVTDYLNGDNDLFFFNSRVKDNYKLGGIQADKSYIKDINSFPLNTEIKTVKTYTHDKELLTYELNSSIVLLPEKAMRARYFDPRVGYFSRGYQDYDAPQGVDPHFMITRWRIEPRDEDIGKYKRGELVEPKKPIIYYIDPATPQKWVPYLIKGVNAWQKAFEKAGFKNAIYALEAPVEDSTWSLEDARHSAIIYKASPIQNASGPQVSDPRSGEILESHINWYHNVQQVLHDWYFIQASPNDPEARKMQFTDSLMGRLIQFVCTHEVGHTLGLMHNFGASSTIPVDSLRSRRYIAKNGHTPSVMDYARFNYVAQPEDSISVSDLVPNIGVYDEWAIEWGYRCLPETLTKGQEEEYLKKWIVQRQALDKRLFFGGGSHVDVRSTWEDLGDDPIKASYYGIKNLKYVMSHLVQWTNMPGKDYTELTRLNDAIVNQYTLYIMHVLRTIGGEYEDQKTGDQEGPVWTFVEKKKQREAMQFLHEQLFNTPAWLIDKQIYSLSGAVNEIAVMKLQSLVANLLNYNGFYPKTLFAKLILPAGQSYSFDEVLTDFEEGAWRELNKHENISFTRRLLQKSYVDNLSFYIRLFKQTEIGEADYCTILNDHVGRIYKKIIKALPGYSDGESKLHLIDTRDFLKMILEIQKTRFMDQTRAMLGVVKKNNNDHILLYDHSRQKDMNLINTKSVDQNCWSVPNWKDWLKMIDNLNQEDNKD